MSKPDQPKTTVRATASRAYVFDPDERRMVCTWDGAPLVALKVVITAWDDGKVSAKCTSAVMLRKDGTVGTQPRSASRWWSIGVAPQWVQDLAADMPTLKVTLVPPKGKQP